MQTFNLVSGETDTGTGWDGADNPRPHLLPFDPERPEHPGRQPFLLAQQPEQDVLGADLVVPERPRIILGKHQNLPGTIREPLKHLKGDATGGTTLGCASVLTPHG
jgi:hypothetical protein